MANISEIEAKIKVGEMKAEEAKSKKAQSNEEVAKPKEKEAETVSVPKKDWDKVMARISALEGDDTHDVLGADNDEVKPLECRVRLFHGRPITKIVNKRQVGVDEVSKTGIMHCSVVTIDADGKEVINHNIDWKDVIAVPAVKGIIVETKRAKKTVKGDLVAEKVFNEKTGNMVETGREVYLAVNYFIDKFVVEVNGETVVLEEVNI